MLIAGLCGRDLEFNTKKTVGRPAYKRVGWKSGNDGIRNSEFGIWNGLNMRNSIF